MKIKEKEEAIKLRSTGESISVIADQLGVSRGSVSKWVSHIQLTSEQKQILARKNPVFKGQNAGAQKNKKIHEQRREDYQKRGRERAFIENEGYRIGCTLYWAEGDKSRNMAGMTNTDPEILKVFVSFLKKHFQCGDEKITIRIMAHLNNGISEDEINNYWLKKLDLPKSCLRKFILKTKYYSDVNKKNNKHIYGACSVRVCDVSIVQQIYGSIQEIFSFNNENWMA